MIRPGNDKVRAENRRGPQATGAARVPTSLASAAGRSYTVTMTTYSLGQLTLSELEGLATVVDRGTVTEIWDEQRAGELGAREQLLLDELRGRLLSYKTQLVNEATIWARAIYPLLVLAERDNVRAFAGVPLAAKLPKGELRGEVDGALARMGIEGDAAPPYLLVVEAKRGVEGHDPVAQLLGGLLCAAVRNHAHRAKAEHVLYGVYTIADVWTMVRVVVSGLDGEQPVITTVSSREYTEKTEADVILRLLKGMVVELAS
ncbi:MAG: hypothetical protein U0359_29890 [Byssovorax sp.]